MDTYLQFRKAIGLKHGHKGYLKKVFKKKIRPEHEKELYINHPSSESSDSEQAIDSEDDVHIVNMKDVDPELLRQTMSFRLERHKVEQRMKELKRKIIADSAKELTHQRKIQRIKEALLEVWKELSLIPVARKQELYKMKCPVILYPENIHSEFFYEKKIDEDNYRKLIMNEMANINDAVCTKVNAINEFITKALDITIDKVVEAEINDLIDAIAIFYPIVDDASSVGDRYFEKLKQCKSSDDSMEKIEIKEKQVNYILQILSSMKQPTDSQETPDAELQPVVKVTSKVHSSIKEEGKVKKPVLDSSEESFSDEDFEIFELEKKVLKPWKDVNAVPSTITNSSSDVSNTDLHNATSLDCLVKERYEFLAKDYYIKPHNTRNENWVEVEQKFDNLEFENNAKMLFDLDVSRVFEDILSYMKSDERSKGIMTDVFFPVYPDGGQVLTKEVMLSMENKDPGSYPYSSFFQEDTDEEEAVMEFDVEHIVPKQDLTEAKYDLTPLPLQDFVLVDVNKILGALSSFLNTKSTTLENEQKIKNLQNILMKVKKERMYVEQELLAVQREKAEEMLNKFSSEVNLDSLQDVIENPYLRIMKYESNNKIESLKLSLNKLKASEVIGLKSLDKYGLEHTRVCHKYRQLRQEFENLNNKYSSKVHVIPKMDDIPSCDKD